MPSDFRKAFSSAKKKGQKTFTYGGKKYTTTTASEKAKKQDWVANIDSGNKAKRKGNSKSQKEISESYLRQAKKQLTPKKKKKK